MEKQENPFALKPENLQVLADLHAAKSLAAFEMRPWYDRMIYEIRFFTGTYGNVIVEKLSEDELFDYVRDVCQGSANNPLTYGSSL